jgi:hypothetical protein
MPVVLALLRVVGVCWVLATLGVAAAFVWVLHLDRVDQREAERAARLAAHKADIRSTDKAYSQWNGKR